MIIVKEGVMEIQENEIDMLFRLAQEDPIGFERKRREMITQCINEARTPQNKRDLIRLQAHIENERKRFKGSQMHFANYIFGKMFSSFLELNWQLEPFRSPHKPKKRHMRLISTHNDT